MRSKIMGMFAYLVIVLMVLSTLPIGALAAEDDAQNSASDELGTDRENADGIDDVNDTDDIDDTDDVDDRRSVRERVDIRKDRMETRKDVRTRFTSDGVEYRTKERIENVRNDYSDAKKDFHELRIKIKNKEASADSVEVVEATRAYMIHTIEYMITHLETIKENNGNAEASEIIDEYIVQLEQQKENVESAQTRQEFAEAAKEVRNIWKDAEKRAKYFAGKSVDRRLDNYLAKSDALSLRIEGEINRLRDAGEDVEDLEEMLAEYNELIEEAKQNQELARETIRDRNGDDDDSVDEANKYMREATRNIQEANKVLKDLFDELKSHRRGGSVSLDGAGTLTTEGSGTAVFSGNLTIDINATDAKLVIKDLVGDAEIIIEGEYTKVNDDDEDEEDDDSNRALVYHDFTGTAHITGSRLTVMVHGDDLSITAEGEGSSILSGRGSYNVDKDGVSSDEMKWAGDDDDEDEVDDSDDESDDEDDSNDPNSDGVQDDSAADENETDDSMM